MGLFGSHLPLGAENNAMEWQEGRTSSGLGRQGSGQALRVGKFPKQLLQLLN